MAKRKTGVGDGTNRKHEILHGMMSLFINATKTGKNMMLGKRGFSPLCYHIYDALSGEGNYIHKGKKYIGSPMQIMHVVFKTKNPKNPDSFGLPMPVHLHFSDIEESKVNDLKVNAKEAYDDFVEKYELTDNITYDCIKRDASDTIIHVMKKAKANPLEMYVLWVDPNALIDMPVEALQQCIAADYRNIAIMVNISVIAIKRTLGAYLTDDTIKRTSSLLNHWITQGVKPEDVTIPFIVKEIFGKHAEKVFINEESMGAMKFHVACRFRQFYGNDIEKGWVQQGIKKMKEIAWS